MTNHLFEQFSAYTDNTLPGNQRQALEQQLATDAALRAELEAYHQFRYSIESVALKQRLEHLHHRLNRQGALTYPTHSLPPPIRFRPGRPARVAVVMGLILLLAGAGIYWATRPTRAEQVFLSYYQSEPIARNFTDCGFELAPGVQAYRSRQYQQALTEFNKLPGRQPCVYYYRGLVQLALGRAPAAIADLEKAVAPQPAAPGLTSQKADWYLALAYLKSNRPGDARRQLGIIAGQAGHPFQRVARKALADYDHA